MTNRRVLAYLAVGVTCTLLAVLVGTAVAQGSLTAQEQLGKSLFFDQNLSLNGNQSCATCHAPSVGWTGPDEAINAHGAVYEGSIPGAFGDRKPPAAAYAGDSPILQQDADGVCSASGTAEPPAGGWATRWPSRPRAHS